MNIYICAAGNVQYIQKLLRELGVLFDQENIFLLPEDFPSSSFLDFHMYSGDVLILIPRDKQQLEDLLEMQELLQDFRLILILPASDNVSITRGHLLMPRFLTFIDNDMVEILDVLRRMTAQ